MAQRRTNIGGLVLQPAYEQIWRTVWTSVLAVLGFLMVDAWNGQQEQIKILTELASGLDKRLAVVETEIAHNKGEINRIREAGGCLPKVPPR